MLQNLPAGSEGLSRVKDVFRMPCRISLSLVRGDQTYSQGSIRIKSKGFFGLPCLIIFRWFGR